MSLNPVARLDHQFVWHPFTQMRDWLKREPIVLVDCCASTAGLQAHLAGLAILSRNIGPHQLRLTQLHETYLAAPEGDPTPDVHD